MTVIAQTRDMDMREVLKYTLGPLPWSLATPEGLYVKTSKSKLAEVLEKDVDPCAEKPDASVYILDGMALLQSIKNVPRTFGDLAEYMLKLIIRTARNTVRVDFVTDTYPELSIKNLERSKRAADGSYAVKITASAQHCPQKWAKYLALGSNKEALIKFFVTYWQNDKYADSVGDKVIFVSPKHTCYKLSKMSHKIRLERVEELCSTQEEADTKIFLHANHAAALGHSSILIKSSDTDVEVMALYFKWDIQARLYLLQGTKNKS